MHSYDLFSEFFTMAKQYVFYVIVISSFIHLFETNFYPFSAFGYWIKWTIFKIAKKFRWTIFLWSFVVQIVQFRPYSPSRSATFSFDFRILWCSHSSSSSIGSRTFTWFDLYGIPGASIETSSDSGKKMTDGRGLKKITCTLLLILKAGNDVIAKIRSYFS